MLSSNQKKSTILTPLYRPTWLKSGITWAVLAAFIWTSFAGCSSGPSAGDRGEKVVEELSSIADPLERATASVFALNALCTLSRVASGQVQGRVEQALASYFSSLEPAVMSRVQALGQTLAAIPASTRSDLLGDFAQYDPGACDIAPAWDSIRNSVIFSHRLLPRLRTNYCSGNFTYADSTPANRAITSESLLLFTSGDPEFPDVLEAGASPVIRGIEGEFVTGRHPALEATRTEDGMTPFGVDTGIPCSPVDDASCDASQGLICGGKIGSENRCVAFPVVQKDQELILRGYNFWDVTEARLVLEPLIPGQGAETTSIVSLVDANEPTNGSDACPVPSVSNPTHNRAHFRVTANEGHFYKLRMYNHNGTFFTQEDAEEDRDPRVIHVCYPDSAAPSNVPPGTIRDCTLPVETCVQDGAECSATWGTPPRKLEACGHAPGAPPTCGETPEWFESKLLTRRPDVFFHRDQPIVFVQSEEPSYELKATLQAVECEEETGWDILGSDEPMLLVAGFSNGELPPGEDADLLGKLDESIEAWKGGDYDSGDRDTEVQLLSHVDGLTFDNQVLYLLLSAEDDSFLGGFLAGAAVIVGVAAIIYLSGGAALWQAALGTAGALAIWQPIMSSLGEDDLLGRAMFTGTPLNFEERIGSTHAPDFLTVSPPLFGPLPTLGDPLEGERAARVIHPFVDFSLEDEPLEAECNPGLCSSGNVCLVNRCVDPGFVDPTTNVGFKERREFALGGGHYAFDILWERIKTP